jgi:acetyl coenzyme A synthetase (ADP forming)-like protein
MLAEFFGELSIESRYKRFMSAATPGPTLIARLADDGDPAAAFTFIVTRVCDGKLRIIATGSYLARDAKSAEIAMAVADTFQNRGLGTLLLERLALKAVRHGFTSFWALTTVDNSPMLDVFRASGFEIQERSELGGVEIDLEIAATEKSVARLETRDRVGTVASMRPFFQPNAVAVVGASRDASAIGHRIFTGLLHAGFCGPVYPVNPKATEIVGHKAYHSVTELPGPVDLAIIAVPHNAVMGVIADCAARGVRALVVISAGFAEVGGEGVVLQKALVEKVRGYGMRLIGPNCLGLLNTDPHIKLNASFSPVFPPQGRIAMSSQSGAVGLAVLAAASRDGMGFSSFVSVGNKADVSGNDLLQYWEEDPSTDVILLYLESFGNPRRFSSIARRVGRRKPVVVLHSGLTHAGGRAAGSHTAALATNATAVEALFRQTGVIRAGSLEEMFDLAHTLNCQPLPSGLRVAIVTNAGGPGILATDACEAGGLSAPEPSSELRAKLSALIPGAASLKNPLDLIAAAGPAAYHHAIESVLNSGEYDAVLVIYTPVGLADTKAVTHAITKGVTTARLAGATGKPVLACFLGQEGKLSHLECSGERIPCYPFPETPASVLGKVAKYAAWRNQPPEVIPDFDDLDIATARMVCRRVLVERGAGWLSVEETHAVLKAVGLPLVPGQLARTADDAVKAAGHYGFPVAVKLASRQLIHKSEVGSVKLNLVDDKSVRLAFEAIREQAVKSAGPDAMDGVIVQPMISGGVEVMAGVAQDPLFGPLVAFGLGGVFVELMADVCFRVAPLSDRDATEMVRGIRGFKLLEGYRGHPAADLAAIEDILLRVSRLAEEVPEIGEIDLNPIFAFAPGKGCQIPDARIRVRVLQ